jgi:hypothetical protein
MNMIRTTIALLFLASVASAAYVDFTGKNGDPTVGELTNPTNWPGMVLPSGSETGRVVQTSKNPGIVHELYDLESDPAEKTNLAQQKPEIVQQLVKASEDWQEECGLVDYSEILKIRPNHTK